MRYLRTLSVILASIALSIVACKIKVKMQSQTDVPFQMRIYVPAIKIKTERVTFTKKEESRIVLIEGEKCDQKQWIFKTWRKVDGEWVPARETKAKFEGFGSFGIVVGDDLLPIIRYRFAVFCSEGFC